MLRPALAAITAALLGLTVSAATAAEPMPASAAWGRVGTHAVGGWGAAAPSGAVANVPRSFATTDGDVYAMATLGTVLFIGGAFTHVVTSRGVSVPENHLAALDASTGDPLTGWTGNADNVVRALALSPDSTRLYVGGDFLTIDASTAHRHIAALSPTDGSLVTDWVPTTDGSVRALAASNSAVYLGGDFAHINGVAATNIAAVDTNTGVGVPGWNVSVDNEPYHTSSPTFTDGRVQAFGISPDGNTLYLGGYINHVSHLGQTVADTTHTGAAAVSTVDGSVLTAFKPAFLGGPAHEGMNPFAFVTNSRGHLYVAIGGLRNRLYDVDPTTGATHWVDGASNDFQTAAVYGRYLYTGGHIHTNVTDGAGTHPAFEAVRVSPQTGLMDTSWNPGLGPADLSGNSYYGVWTMLATPAGLYMGGAFLKAGGANHPHLAFYPAT